MMEQYLINIASFFFGLLVLWVLIVYFLRDLAVDYYRQNMFALRDSLFDAAAEGLIAFDHPAYGLLRSTMNGFLRYGHKVTLLGVFVQYLFLRKELKEFKKHSFEYQWKLVIKDLPTKTLERLGTYRQRMIILVGTQALIGSPLLMVLLFCCIILVFPALILLALKNQILTWLGEKLNPAESAAMAFGQAS